MNWGPWIQYTRTKNGNRKIDQVDPYGAGKFGMIGAFVNLQFDTRHAWIDEEMNLVLPLHENSAAAYGSRPPGSHERDPPHGGP